MSWSPAQQPVQPEWPQIEPSEWITIDLETIAGSPDDAERYIVNCYRVDSFGTWSEITIGKRIKEAHAKKLEKLSLLSAAPIICVSLRTPTSLHCYHWMDKATDAISDQQATRAVDQTEMLMDLRDYLDEWTGPDTTLVGHNIANFDLPKLRWAYARYGVRMPAILAAAHPQIYDTMQVYTKRFAVGSGSMIGLDALLEEFQVDSHKGLVSGADVQQLYDEGHHDTIIQYALLDVLAESELYLRMTGRSETLQ